MADESIRAARKIRAVCFDFMGTCLDWHAIVVATLPHEIPEPVRSDFALNWRQLYFDRNAGILRDGKPTEDFDLTLRHTLEQMLDRHANIQSLFSPEMREQLISAWHQQKAWPDVPGAVRKLREQNFEVFVYANGTTRLQLDLCRSSGLEFDMLFSSELLGVYKPAPESYQKFLQFIKRRGDECVMVAAHNYDVLGARKAGMKTVYIQRWTDDIEEDMEEVKKQHDAFLPDMTSLHSVINQFG